MNIFVLDEDPTLAAIYHNNKHVVKMIIESAQMLSSAYYKENNYKFQLDFSKEELQQRKYPRDEFMKLTHINHPCSKWTRVSLENWNWLLDLGLALCKEYTFRYEKEHKTEKTLKWMKLNQPKSLLSIGLTPFVKAMPDYIKKVVFDPVEAYRLFYFFEKDHIADWKKRDIPIWYKEFESVG